MESGRKNFDPCGRQLDRERQAIQRAQISATAGAFSGSSTKSGLTATARCTNSATAGY